VAAPPDSDARPASAEPAGPSAPAVAAGRAGFVVDPVAGADGSAGAEPAPDGEAAVGADETGVGVAETDGALDGVAPPEGVAAAAAAGTADGAVAGTDGAAAGTDGMDGMDGLTGGAYVLRAGVAAATSASRRTGATSEINDSAMPPGVQVVSFGTRRTARGRPRVGSTSITRDSTASVADSGVHHRGGRTWASR
jgi:hypothetical protein